MHTVHPQSEIRRRDDLTLSALTRPSFLSREFGVSLEFLYKDELFVSVGFYHTRIYEKGCDRTINIDLYRRTL